MIVGFLLTLIIGLAARYCGWLPNHPFDAFVAGAIIMMFFGLWLRSKA